MKENRVLRASMLVAMLVCAGIVVNYYWQNSELAALATKEEDAAATSLLSNSTA